MAEGPTYDSRTDKLYWLDIEQKRVYFSHSRLEPFFNSLKNSSSSFSPSFSFVSIPETVSVLGLTKIPNVFIVGAKHGYATLDLRPFIDTNTNTDTNTESDKIDTHYTTQLKYISKILQNDNNNSDSSFDPTWLRFNDGGVDSAGRFFAGTMVE